MCLALNPVGNVHQAVMNRFGRRLFQHVKVDPQQPVQLKSFIGSYTSLRKESLPGDEAHRILDSLGIAPESFVLVPEDDRREADHIFILRHTLMNPWLLDGPSQGGYIELFWEYLEKIVDEVLEDVEGWR